MITSRDNTTLKLVRKLASKRDRIETGLFVAEGEDLVAAAVSAAIEPVELLVEGENVAPGLLGRVSSLAHPPRVVGIYRAADLPRGARDVCLALWRLADPGTSGRASAAPTRSARASHSRTGARIRWHRRRSGRRRARSSGCRWWGGTTCRGAGGLSPMGYAARRGRSVATGDAVSRRRAPGVAGRSRDELPHRDDRVAGRGGIPQRRGGRRHRLVRTPAASAEPAAAASTAAAATTREALPRNRQSPSSVGRARFRTPTRDHRSRAPTRPIRGTDEPEIQ